MGLEKSDQRGVNGVRAVGEQAHDVLAACEALVEGLLLCGEFLAEEQGAPCVRCIAHESGASSSRRVKISAPSAVTTIVCSHWADGRWSFVTTVQ